MARTTRGRSTSRVSDGQILDAARRVYVEGELQKDVCKDLGISQGYLTKKLAEARERGWVRVFVDVEPQFQLASELRRAWPNLVDVLVVAGVPETSTPALRTAASHRMAAALAGWLDRRLDDRAASVRCVAVGGGRPARGMVDQLVQRAGGVDVVPSALSPVGGATIRHSSPLVATLLAFRLGALGAEPPEGRHPGQLFDLRVEPPRGSIDGMRRWFAELAGREDFRRVREAWARSDVVFTGGAPLTLPSGESLLYPDVAGRLAELGLDGSAIRQRGARLVFANQFVDANGKAVPLASGVPSYEPSIPLDMLREAAADEERRVVLTAWGDLGGELAPVLRGELVNTLVCDETAARGLLAAAPR